MVLDKQVGETPLEVIKRYKSSNPRLSDLPMAYAGRLDPMASGQLLILIGDECKRQEHYHSLDKGYRFEVLLGSSSDTADILGLVNWEENTNVDFSKVEEVAHSLQGQLSLPYPQFSSRTVKGKPLHTWTLEGRLGEIEIPTAETMVYSLKVLGIRTESVNKVYEDALRRIESVATVTEERKALGRDFRRQDVRVAWQVWREHYQGEEVQILSFECLASSGTYMRSMAEEIGRQLGVSGMAYTIHRFAIGQYVRLPFGLGFWLKRFN